MILLKGQLHPILKHDITFFFRIESYSSPLSQNSYLYSPIGIKHFSFSSPFYFSNMVIIMDLDERGKLYNPLMKESGHSCIYIV